MMIDLIKSPVLTEKTVRLIENDQYVFDVDLRLSKLQIKKIIEELFRVKVISINTHRPPRKKRRLGAYQGTRSSSKRVIIRLKSGQYIQLLPETESKE
uniref:Large ribosomal subunit protein uL23c n=1 Tax=Pleurastrosarcina brevispinosa TaxID=163096 RepID=A0A097KN59_9CHLO|nr:ribosomal protein L23 [Chlorosarcina brevispinosa]